MKIFLAGATGRTGRLILEEALSRGHKVKAIVRDPDKLTITHPELTITKGTPYRTEDIKNQLRGIEAVMIALNVSRTSDFPWATLRAPKDLLERSVRNIIQEMEREKIKRIITISACGVGETRKQMPSLFMWLSDHSNIGIAYQGHAAQEKELMESTMDWTIVRPVGLSNSQESKPVRIYLNGKGKVRGFISRYAVAEFMLDCIEKKKYIHTAPSISN